MAEDMSMSDAFYEQLARIVEANLENEQFGVSELAKEVGLSRSQVHRKLHALTGHSVSYFIREIRLQRAHELLQGQVGTASEIAYKVGFGSPTYFNKCFHNYFGYTPGEVKKLQESTDFKAKSDRVLRGHKPRIRPPALVGHRKYLLVSVTAIIILAAGYILLSGDKKEINSMPGGITESSKSIAVLPFVNMGNDPQQQYFSDGISEAIINALAQIPNLKVASRTSAFMFRDPQQDVKSIAKTLGVASILEGSVRRSDNKIRVTAQLINASDGFHLWSNTYEREYDDIFIIQDELSKSIVEALQMEISEEQSSLLVQQTHNPEAYNLYLRGRYFWNKRTKQGLEQSILFFEQALEKDSLYALAYGGLADSYLSLGGWGISNPNIVYPKAKQYILKALALDNSRGQFHASLGTIQYEYEWEWQTAEKSYQTAIRLDPNYPQVRIWYFMLAAMLGDYDKAELHITKAVENDPLSIIANFQLARHYMQLGNLTEALKQAKKTLALDETSVPTNWTLYNIYYEMGEHDLAFEHFMKTNSVVTQLINVKDHSQIVSAYQRGGWPEVGKTILHSIQSQSVYVSPGNYARLYILMKNYDKALDYLEMAFDQKDPHVAFIRLFPEYLSLHKEPRYQALLKKLNLPPV